MSPSQPLKREPILKPVPLQVLTSFFFLEKMEAVLETGFLILSISAPLFCPRTLHDGLTGNPD